MITPEALMRLAIAKARAGLAAGQAPFGCAIARGDAILAVEHNTVAATTDCTAHAEVNALRAACLAAGENKLHGAVVATTCEPCPMCAGAMHWADVEVVYYGASIDDAEEAELWQLEVGSAALLARGGSRVRVVGGVLVQECRALFDDWRKP
jgi:tRNA(Arg) A34 adenosine deaminase TadA